MKEIENVNGLDKTKYVRNAESERTGVNIAKVEGSKGYNFAMPNSGYVQMLPKEGEKL